MRPISHFRFCPRCGQPLPAAPAANLLQCQACGFCYYFNPALAAAAFILRADGRVLFIRRARNPGKGKLTVPGGFVDFDETAEAALRREIKEEVGIEVGALEFLCSQTNDYPYQEVTYPVVDFFFVAQAEDTNAGAFDGVESCAWLDPAQIDSAELAFRSVREALRRLLARGA